MNIVQITPGAGGMYCGGCFRDNALVAALRKQGHSTLMVPLYLPLTLDEQDQSNGTPIFFGGISVYLDQKSALFRKGPQWLHNLLNKPALLKLAAGSAAKTRASDLGEITLSMIRGEEGNQARELQELIAWLKTQPRPDVICLSNALLIGMVRRLKAELKVPVACLLSGEDTFLDALPYNYRQVSWQTLAERAAEVDLFISPSRYFGDLMKERLNIPQARLRVLPNGINLEGYAPPSAAPHPPVLGYFARMCREKGLEMAGKAFLLLKQRGRIPNLKFHIGGGMGPSDEPLVEQLREEFRAAGILGDVSFFPNLTREAKLDFLRNLSVLSVPALYGEAFGLYVIEALASGVPVVQPRHAAFPELLEATGGGLLCEPTASSVAETVEQLLLDPARARALGETGRQAVLEKFNVDRMATDLINIYETALAGSTANA